MKLTSTVTGVWTLKGLNSVSRPHALADLIGRRLRRERDGGVKSKAAFGFGCFDIPHGLADLRDRCLVSGHHDDGYAELTRNSGVPGALGHVVPFNATRVRVPLENVCARTPPWLLVPA